MSLPLTFLRSLLLGLLLTIGIAGAAPAQESTEQPTVLDPLFDPKTLWETKGEAFVTAHQPFGFRWNSTERDSAETTRSGLTLYGTPVVQTIIRIQAEKVQQVTAYFYNRGDSGEIPRGNFEALIRDVAAKTTAATGVALQPRGRDSGGAVRAYGLTGEGEAASYLLEYSFTPGASFRAEFVRLEITPKQERGSLLQEAAQRVEKENAKVDPSVNVTREASGDVLIKNVPMVDQGQKGYCAVASAERVLRYYGIRVDSHELAQLADSSAEGGTSIEAMTDSLKRLASRFRVRTRIQIDTDSNDFLKLIRDYNRLGRRTNLEQIYIGQYANRSDILAKMDYQTLRTTKLRSKGDVTKFGRIIRAHIDKGVPLLWSVTLGLFSESSSSNQSVGGHMRLIIGYNDKTQEVLYSDSWGLGHELKRMPWDDAWVITSQVTTMEPL